MLRRTAWLLAAIALTACYGDLTGEISGEARSRRIAEDEDSEGIGAGAQSDNQAAENDSQGNDVDGNDNDSDPGSGIGAGAQSDNQAAENDNQGSDDEGSSSSGGDNDNFNSGDGSAVGFNNPPIGVLDSVSGGIAWGWACDKDQPASSIQVHIYVGGSAGSGAKSFAVTANRSSEGSVAQACNGGNAHRFKLQIPNWEAFANQPVYAYAIDTAGGKNPLLSNAPLTLPAGSSAPPPPSSNPSDCTAWDEIANALCAPGTYNCDCSGHCGSTTPCDAGSNDSDGASSNCTAWDEIANAPCAPGTYNCDCSGHCGSTTPC